MACVITEKNYVPCRAMEALTIGDYNERTNGFKLFFSTKLNGKKTLKGIVYKDITKKQKILLNVCPFCNAVLKTFI